MSTSKKDRELLSDYLQVCNAAMSANKDSFLYKQLISLSGFVFSGRNFAALLYDDDPDLPDGVYTVRFTGDHLELVSEGKRDVVFSCKMQRSYLRTVAENRQDYIDHPEKLDWQWLKSRLGFAPPDSPLNAPVSTLITEKLSPITPQTSVQDAAAKMWDLNIAALVVLDGESPVGIITDRDIVTRIVAGGTDPSQTKVEDVMTRGVVCCAPDLGAKAAAAIMEEKHVRRILVLDSDQRPFGLLSLDDLALHLTDKDFVGEFLSRMAAQERRGRPIVPVVT
jgi:CBS domain-containing protein